VGESPVGDGDGGHSRLLDTIEPTGEMLPLHVPEKKRFAKTISLNSYQAFCKVTV